MMVPGRWRRRRLTRPEEPRKPESILRAPHPSREAGKRDDAPVPTLLSEDDLHRAAGSARSIASVNSLRVMAALALGPRNSSQLATITKTANGNADSCLRALASFGFIESSQPPFSVHSLTSQGRSFLESAAKQLSADRR